MIYALGRSGKMRYFGIWPAGHFKSADLAEDGRYGHDIHREVTLGCKKPPEFFPSSSNKVKVPEKLLREKSFLNFPKIRIHANFVEISGARSARQDFKNFIFGKYEQFPLF